MNKDVHSIAVLPGVAEVGCESEAAADDDEQEMRQGKHPITDGHKIRGSAAHNLQGESDATHRREEARRTNLSIKLKNACSDKCQWLSKLVAAVAAVPMTTSQILCHMA
jgi:hypothetical protein